LGANQICKKEKVEIMPDKLVFEVIVEIDPTQRSRLRGPAGAHDTIQWDRPRRTL
jgi:hypothetical protein